MVWSTQSSWAAEWTLPRENVMRPNRVLGSAGQLLWEAEGGDEPGIEKKRHLGDAYV